MLKKIISKVVFVLLVTAGSCAAGSCTKSPDSKCTVQKEIKLDKLEEVLQQLNQKTTKLESYTCNIEYLWSQPLFESETLRKGVLYYQKFGRKSKLRINFDIVKYDDGEEEKKKIQYVFDGVWLTILDYQNKTHQRRQLVREDEPNKPKDSFELVSNNFPLVGFIKTDKLKKQFEITLVENEENKKAKPIQLHLKVKPDSIYKDDYEYIDSWIDKEVGLPTKIIAVNLEKDIYQIKLIKPKINNKLNKEVFEIKPPKGFGKLEVFPLEDSKNEHGKD